MPWQYTPYTIPLLVSAGMSVALAAFVVSRARPRQRELGLLAFTTFMLAAAVWSFGNAFQISSTGYEAKFLWRVVGYVGHNLIPIAVLAFALQYAGGGRHVTRRRLALLATPPLVAAVAGAPTNPLHHLMWADFDVVDLGTYSVLDPTFGPWYWLNTAYNYVLVIVALLLFVRLAVSAGGRVHRRQAGMFLAGVSLPFVSNVAWVFGVTPVDFTPIAFAAMGVVFAVDIVHFQLLDVLPVARGTVIQNMRDGYIVVDDEGRIVDTNPTTERILDDPDPVGQPATEVLPATLQRYLEEDGGVGDELVVEGPDGPQYYDVQVSRLSDGPTGGRLVLLRDVTARRATEERFRLLIENASDLVTTLDPDGTVTYMSPSVKPVLGYEPGYFEGRDPFEYMHPEDRERTRAAFQEWVEKSGSSGTIEYRFRHADGSWRWMEGRVRNLLDEPAIEGMAVNSRDVTRRKRRERDLERQNERLEEFTGVVSHDLRNPLAVIDGYTDLVRETGEEQYVDGIEDAVDRMNRLIDDLLRLARQGRTIEDPESVDLADAVTMAWRHVDTGDADLRVGDDLGAVQADRERLVEMLENLFRNAVEHVGDDVTVTVDRVDGGFAVADDGPGIPAEKREQVFAHGYTTNDRGTGFGLSIVRTIAAAHGWTVRVDESGSGGARFVFEGVE